MPESLQRLSGGPAGSAARKTELMRALTVTLLVLIALATASLLLGAASFSWSQWQALFDLASSDQSHLAVVLLELRLPRTLLAIMTGSALAVGGALMQSLFRNPLAEPGLVGISAGSALGAATAMMLGLYGYAVVGLAGIAGSLLATVFAWRFSRRHPETFALLLAGLAINAFCLSLITLMISLASDTQMRSIVFWSMGSLTRVPLWVVLMLVPLWLACIVWALRQWPVLNALLLGQEQAGHVGVNVSRVRWQMIMLMAVLLGPLISVTGVISFVGLLVPQALRRYVGSHHRRLLPMCAVWGAIVVLVADLLGRMLVAPAELPVGVVISLVGAPVFLWLLCLRPR